MTAHPHDHHWPRLLAVAEAGGAPALIAAIREEEDPGLRRALFLLSLRRIASSEFPNASLDTSLEVARAAIAEGVRQAESEADSEEAARRKDFANVLSYNLSADLAECWPEDPRPRRREHFEAGLQAAEDCLRWREELDKGPMPFSLAHWAHGIHALSLGRIETAIRSFEASLSAAREAARRDERSPTEGAESTFGVHLGLGYLGIARMRSGDPEGEDLLDRALACFDFQRQAHPEESSEVDFGIAQLRTAEERTRGAAERT